MVKLDYVYPPSVHVYLCLVFPQHLHDYESFFRFYTYLFFVTPMKSGDLSPRVPCTCVEKENDTFSMVSLFHSVQALLGTL